jgi:hypothetical protein
MGCTLTPIAVDLGKISRLIGSKDESLLGLLVDRFGSELDAIDATAGGVEKAVSGDEGEGDLVQCRPPCASAAEVLRHFVMGEEHDHRVGFKYGYVLQRLCEHFGERLPNDCWCDLRYGAAWFQELDDALEKAGVSRKAFSVCRHLTERGSPIPIPEYHDFPFIGYLTAAEVRPALTALCNARFDDIGDEEDEAEDDVWLPAEFEEIRRWLEFCAETNQDLVCFYS